MIKEQLGNKELLQINTTGFLCSRKVPASVVLKRYDWAITQREKGNCVISGFHSQLEKDVLHYLLKGKQPIIDEIDTALAAHYGFTDEELDFIINYDIKYRMGKELEGEEE